MNNVPTVTAGLVLCLGLAACDPGGGPASVGPEEEAEQGTFCAVSAADLVPVLGPDQIPALVDPELVAPDHPGAARWLDESRVVGLLVEGAPIAVPLGVLRHHEIVNLNRGDSHVAVSYCPLTGSAITFDRSTIDEVELGVSGVLMRNNLVMFERGVNEPSFFAQMTSTAVCGPLARRRHRLPTVASWEMRWGAWKALYPGTRVVTFDTGYARAYDVNLNAEYEELNNPDRLIAVPLDPRRPPKERVLGVPLGLDGGPAFPFEAMKAHARLVLSFSHAGRPAVMLWDRSAEAATAFYSDLDGHDLTLEAIGDGYRDAETGSAWRLDGLSVGGPFEGRRLEPVEEAYVAFWFAWADFHPETVVRTR